MKRRKLLPRVLALPLVLFAFSVLGYSGTKCDGTESTKCTAANTCQIGTDCIVILSRDDNNAIVQPFVNNTFTPVGASDFFCVSEGTSIHWTATSNEFFDVRINTDPDGSPFQSVSSLGGDANAPVSLQAINEGCFPFLVTVCDIPPNAAAPVTCKILDPKVVVQGGGMLYEKNMLRQQKRHSADTDK